MKGYWQRPLIRQRLFLLHAGCNITVSLTAFSFAISLHLFHFRQCVSDLWSMLFDSCYVGPINSSINSGLPIDDAEESNKQ
jgi:hypothetical protein